MEAVVELDGSRGEGGGQILRSALTLSMLTGRPFRIHQIRARRDTPGLRPQHLEAVKAAQSVSSALVDGAAVGSSELSFHPSAVSAGDYDFRIPTAGSAPLVLHTVYLPLLLQPTGSNVSVSGGTHVTYSPCYDYLAEAWLPALRRIGGQIELELLGCGFYPRGGGAFKATLQPSPLQPLNWTQRGKLLRLTPISMVANLPDSIAERQAHRADKLLRQTGLKKVTRTPLLQQRKGGSPGTMLGIRAEWENASSFFFALGARGKPAETVAEEAVREFLSFHEVDDSPVDPHLADQLLLPLAFAEGVSQFATTEVTQHLLTNAEVIQRFLKRSIQVEGELGKPGSVTVS